jgi:hypothetical protein
VACETPAVRATSAWVTRRTLTTAAMSRSSAVGLQG